MKKYMIAFLISTSVLADQTITVKDPLKKSNQVHILGGVGPGKRFSVKTSNGTTDVSSKLGLIYGVQYNRRIEQTPAFVGGQLQSNGTFLMSVGAEF